MIYRIDWTENISCWCHVEAESISEARKKFRNHEEIPDSHDTEPGDGVKKILGIYESNENAVHRRNG